MLESIRDLTPIVLVIAFFQIVVVRQPIPNLPEILIGVVLVVLGLTFFVRGLDMALFPHRGVHGPRVCAQGQPRLVARFRFALGFGTTVAEPALIAVAGEAAEVAADGGVIADNPESHAGYALGLRLTVAVSVGVAIVIGVYRILRGWPIQYFIIGGYIAVVAMTPLAPPEIIGIAYDSGGVTTSTITVPLVTALGVGLASSIKGRNAFTDGFGLIAFASLTPMIFVMIYGMVLLTWHCSRLSHSRSWAPYGMSCPSRP